MIQERRKGSEYFEDYSRELRKTGQLIREMPDGMAVIMASTLDKLA